VILDEIVEKKREGLDDLRARAGDLRAAAADAPPVRDFAGALEEGGQVAVIAEFKRRSPSAGAISATGDPASTARDYGRGGARALSVLTDGPHFGGSLEDLAAAREAAGLPVLRKDFLVDPAQVWEARAGGADAVLLIVRILEDGRLRELLEVTREAGMEALVEVHGEEELERALEAGARVVGVNARDLESFEVDLGVVEGLLGRVPRDRLAVAESGIRGGEDVRRVARAGADAVLVGSWLMERSPGAVEAAVSGLCGVPRHGRAAGEGAA
jgi:indole-3-glycerol phosphate synthase